MTSSTRRLRGGEGGPATTRARVLLLDDHPAVLDGLASFLSGTGELEVVATCADVPTAERELLLHTPDVAVVDLKVRGGPVFDLIRQATRRDRRLAVVVLTGHDDEAYVRASFAAGGMAYVLKHDPLSMVLEAIRAARAKRRFASPEILAVLPDLDALAAADLNDSETPLGRLTPRERQILYYIGMGKTAREIGETLNISAWTVANHKAKIMDKLGIRGQIGLARFALSAGLSDARG